MQTCTLEDAIMVHNDTCKSRVKLLKTKWFRSCYRLFLWNSPVDEMHLQLSWITMIHANHGSSFQGQNDSEAVTDSFMKLTCWWNAPTVVKTCTSKMARLMGPWEQQITMTWFLKKWSTIKVVVKEGGISTFWLIQYVHWNGWNGFCWHQHYCNQGTSLVFSGKEFWEEGSTGTRLYLPAYLTFRFTWLFRFFTEYCLSDSW